MREIVAAVTPASLNSESRTIPRCLRMERARSACEGFGGMAAYDMKGRICQAYILRFVSSYRERFKASGRHALTPLGNKVRLLRHLHRPALREQVRHRGLDLAAQLRAQLLGDARGVDAVADDLRPDEDDELGARVGARVAAEQLAELAGADRSAEARCGSRSWRSLIRPPSSTVCPLATAIELLTLRCDTVGVSVCGVRIAGDVADLLLDVEQHVAVDVDARHHAQDDAGVAVIDGVDDRAVGARPARSRSRSRSAPGRRPAGSRSGCRAPPATASTAPSRR